MAPVLLPIWVLACYDKPREFSFSSDPSRRAFPREVGAARSARALRRAMAEVRFGGKRGVCVVFRIQGLGLEVYCMAQGRCCPALNQKMETHILAPFQNGCLVGSFDVSDAGQGLGFGSCVRFDGGGLGCAYLGRGRGGGHGSPMIQLQHFITLQ